MLYRRRTRARHPVINYIFIHRFKNENNPTVNRITHSFQNLKFSHNHFIHCPLTEKTINFPLPVLIKLTINWSNKIQSMKVFICGPPRVNWDWEEKFSKVKKFNISVFSSDGGLYWIEGQKAVSSSWWVLHRLLQFWHRHTSIFTIFGQGVHYELSLFEIGTLVHKDLHWRVVLWFFANHWSYQCPNFKWRDDVQMLIFSLHVESTELECAFSDCEYEYQWENWGALVVTGGKLAAAR